MRIGIDLGGSKIEGIALARDGRVLDRRRMATPRQDYATTLDAIAETVCGIEERLGETGTVGIGMPGALSPATGLVKNANSTWLNGRALAQDLEARLQRPLRFANDANCFALSEALDGAGTGARVVFGVILGTGCGGGLVIEGRVITGPNAIAGEWGHNPLPWPRPDEWPGPECYCGRTGCIETFLSGPGLAADYRRAGGENLAATEIVAAAEHATGTHDAAARARAALDRYEGRLARALGALINVVDPDVIVLGGGLSNLQLLYAGVPRRWGPFVFSDRVSTRLAPPQHGDSSGVRGAAWLWEES